MLKYAKKIYLRILLLFNFIKINKINRNKINFISVFTKFNTNNFKKKDNANTLLVQMVEDFDFCLKIAAASKVLSEKNNAH